MVSGRTMIGILGSRQTKLYIKHRTLPEKSPRKTVNFLKHYVCPPQEKFLWMPLVLPCHLCKYSASPCAVNLNLVMLEDLTLISAVRSLLYLPGSSCEKMTNDAMTSQSLIVFLVLFTTKTMNTVTPSYIDLFFLE